MKEYWLDVLRMKNPATPFKSLAKFVTNLCIIPHSNCYIERMFSLVSINKDKLRNSLEVSTVSTLLKIKSYYQDKETLELTDEHFELYRICIKNT